MEAANLDKSRITHERVDLDPTRDEIDRLRRRHHRPQHPVLAQLISQLAQLRIARLGGLDEMLCLLVDRGSVLCAADQLGEERVLARELGRVLVALDLGEEEREVADRGVVGWRIRGRGMSVRAGERVES